MDLSVWFEIFEKGFEGCNSLFVGFGPDNLVTGSFIDHHITADAGYFIISGNWSKVNRSIGIGRSLEVVPCQLVFLTESAGSFIPVKPNPDRSGTKELVVPAHPIIKI